MSLDVIAERGRPIDSEDLDYFRRLWARRHKALPLRHVAVRYRDGSAPIPGRSHDNVDRWVAEHPGYCAVRGWTFERQALDGGWWTAHSVLKRPWRPLADITLADGRLFLRHLGEEGQFHRLCRGATSVWLPTGLG